MATQDLQANSLLWYLVAYGGWNPDSRNPGSYSGNCLWHPERSGSLFCYQDHAHCYGSGCDAHGDLARLIGVQEFGLTFSDRLHWEVFRRRDERLAEFVTLGGQLPESVQQQKTTISRTQKALSVPGPLQRAVLNRLTEWWHAQLLAPTQEAEQARAYLRERGVLDWVIQRCLVIGYHPVDLHWREATALDNLFRVSEWELEQERRWYREKIYWEELNDEHLSFLRNPHTFSVRIGAINEKGYYRLKGRLVFSCKNRCGRGDTRFYQARVLAMSPHQRIKFLNMPGTRKYPFLVCMEALCLPPEKPWWHMPGTLLTESPFGPLVACSYSLCRVAVATLGEGSPCAEYLCGLPEPIWLGQDNDDAQVCTKGKGLMARQFVSYPGEIQAQLYATFFTEQQMESHRLLPWRQNKGTDEWLNAQGPEPIVATMRQILESKVA
jgi:hypothetical protein